MGAQPHRSHRYVSLDLPDLPRSQAGELGHCSSTQERKSGHGRCARNDGALAISHVTFPELATVVSIGCIRPNLSLECFLPEIEERFTILRISGRACVRAFGFPRISQRT